MYSGRHGVDFLGSRELMGSDKALLSYSIAGRVGGDPVDEPLPMAVGAGDEHLGLGCWFPGRAPPTSSVTLCKTLSLSQPI